jgi:hypothetical protein
VVASAAEETLIPDTAGFDITGANEGLGTHGFLLVRGSETQRAPYGACIARQSIRC